MSTISAREVFLSQTLTGYFRSLCLIIRGFYTVSKASAEGFSYILCLLNAESSVVNPIHFILFHLVKYLN